MILSSGDIDGTPVKYWSTNLKYVNIRNFRTVMDNKTSAHEKVSGQTFVLNNSILFHPLPPSDRRKSTPSGGDAVVRLSWLGDLHGPFSVKNGQPPNAILLVLLLCRGQQVTSHRAPTGVNIWQQPVVGGNMRQPEMPNTLS